MLLSTLSESVGDVNSHSDTNKRGIILNCVVPAHTRRSLSSQTSVPLLRIIQLPTSSWLIRSSQPPSQVVQQRKILTARARHRCNHIPPDSSGASLVPTVWGPCLNDAGHATRVTGLYVLCEEAVGFIQMMTNATANLMTLSPDAC